MNPEEPRIDYLAVVDDQVPSCREDARVFAVQLMREWGLELRRELSGGYCSHVVTDGVLVLKVPFQGEEQTTGRLAAERLAGFVGPKIHRVDVATGSMLMEYVPGEQLAAFGSDDARAMPVFFDLAHKVRQLDPASLPDMDTYFRVRTELIDRLLATTAEKVFLHADLHHLNILWSGARWLAIDPLGFHGDPAFEAVAYLRNPIDALEQIEHLEPFLEGRINALAKGLNVDANRIWAWSLADRRAGSAGDDHAWGRMLPALESLADRFHSPRG